jgi:hypothetical protein
MAKMAKKKIMIVDDNVEFLEELKELLDLSGYETTACIDGDSALAKAREERPDAILLDLKMDDKSGFQVADELRRMPEAANIPIIAMTGYYTEKEHALLVNICGINMRLLKPFNPLDVIAKLESIL